AMVTGGVLAGLNLTPTGTPTPSGGAQFFMDQLGQNLKAGVAKALISTAINGGSLEDSLKANLTTAFIDTAAAQGANWIGDANLDTFTNKIAHALAGCAAGAARAGSEGCAAGAIGAAVGEMAAEAYGRHPDTAQFAGMISAIAAAVAGGNAEQINLASAAGANAAANNYASHSPYAKVKAAVAAENARLTELCGANCTQADFNRIDNQVRQVEFAATMIEVSQRTSLTPAQTIQLAETVAALLPFYGTPIALYQAISGQSLTGTDLSGAERFFNGVAAAIPIGTVAYKLIGGAVADMRLAASFGGFSADGKALMDFSKLSSQQKGVVGELLGANTVQNALPGATRLGRLGEIGSQGIDDLYKVTSASADYVIVEYKFGSSALKTTADGVQMSDGWVLGNERLFNAAGKNSTEQAAIEVALRQGRIEKWVVHTDPAGGTSIWIVDSAGKIAKADSTITSKLLGGRK
ncbi:MAG: DUF637 domain-containing protein, partial [Polaromonas sp.]|uniref:DUF637 domain-containing protein n=1 Tax=Polaromonas sp. TaxID=1869339 RepID=UPI0018265E5D